MSFHDFRIRRRHNHINMLLPGLYNCLCRINSFESHLGGKEAHMFDVDAKYHSAKTPDNCLQEAERGKKRMYLEACLKQRSHFTPFVASVDGLLEVEGTETLKRLASRLATKWRQPYSKTCGYVNSSIAITLVRATHRCIQGSRVPAHRISVQRPQWEDVAGLNLFR